MQTSVSQLLTAARAAAANGAPAEAERLLRRALELESDSLEAHMALAGLLLAANRVGEAASVAERAIQLNPKAGPPHFHLGQCRLRHGRFVEAVDELEIAASLSPSTAAIHHLLGVASLSAGRGRQAEECFRRSISLEPKAVASHSQLGQVLLARGDLEGAVASFRTVAEVQPNSAKGKFFLARALIEDQRFAEGEECLREAMRIDPSDLDSYALLARALQQQGRFEQAEGVLRDLSDRQTDETQGFYLRVTGRTVTEDDRAMLERVERSSNTLEDGPRRSVSYGLGKAFDDLGEYERAVSHYDIANRLSQERLNSLGRVFNAQALERTVDETIARFPGIAGSGGNPTEKPIFIVGMARSGTTLLEQIVSSHPRVEAAGELGTWTSLSSGERFDAGEQARILLAKLDGIAPGDGRVTIKTPQNYLILGQILNVFPNCRILHCRRNPIDTCLSIYTTSFMSGPEFAHDRASLVAAYRQYRRIMDHWRKVLPSDRLLDVDYELLVADREPVLRHVLEFLGLPWSDAVMHHETNAHAISTPSLWQARQPIFSRSVERWKNYEPWLGPILELGNS